ncbi:MAG: TauD/TfdA family dioxygenase [Sandaracinus sp.]
MSVEAALRPLAPFGVEVTVPAGTSFAALDPEAVHAWVAAHRVVVLRGLAPIDKRALPLTARRLGPLQTWEFGAVNELKPKDGTKNYLYTRRAVPLHWDGAFTPRAPRYLFFSCREAPPASAGGATVFVDTTRVWEKAAEPLRDKWRALRFEYRAERVVHYGGAFRSPVVTQHPISGETVLRFAEPVNDLNPVSVRALDASALESAACITELREALSDPSAVLRHSWRDGDVVIADNHALLHGRDAFTAEGRRHIQRVNVHSPERSFWDDVRDSLRIRRLEFMVAEIPILLIPTLLVAPGALATTRFALVAAMFFLLFHFGDMINCLSDRERDAVYKTALSEAVFGLGVHRVRWQLGLTALAAIVLAVVLAQHTGRAEIVGLVLFGLFLGAQYSTGPLWLKSRGLLQIVTLWALIFVGPMTLVAVSLGGALDPMFLALAAAYGAMQEGIVLVNTAEDLPEDAEHGVWTSARALGLRGSVAAATWLVGLGGAVVLGITGRVLDEAGRSIGWLVPLFVAWLWVLRELRRTDADVRAAVATEERAIEALRPWARRVPFWITATAWGTLFAAVAARWGAA